MNARHSDLQALEIAREISDRNRGASCLESQAAIALMQSDYATAVPLLVQVLEIRQYLFGTEHTRTLEVAEIYAEALRKLQELENQVVAQ